MTRTIGALLLLALAGAAAGAAERRPIAEVSIDALTKDTQVTPAGAGDRHVAVVWWVPHEFWAAVMARDTSTTAEGKAAFLDALEGVSLLGVVQADVSVLGAFSYYPEDVVAKALKITVTDAAGKSKNLPRVTKLAPDLEVTLGALKPMLSAAMGNLGTNFHFYVLDDRAGSGRILDPYQRAQLTVQLSKSDKAPLVANIELPLDSLFVPRTCPNGKPAHISWKFCPWNGEPLKD